MDQRLRQLKMVAIFSLLAIQVVTHYYLLGFLFTGVVPVILAVSLTVFTAALLSLGLSLNATTQTGTTVLARTMGGFVIAVTVVAAVVLLCAEVWVLGKHQIDALTAITLLIGLVAVVGALSPLLPRALFQRLLDEQTEVERRDAEQRSREAQRLLRGLEVHLHFIHRVSGALQGSSDPEIAAAAQALQISSTERIQALNAELEDAHLFLPPSHEPFVLTVQEQLRALPDPARSTRPPPQRPPEQRPPQRPPEQRPPQRPPEQGPPQRPPEQGNAEAHERSTARPLSKQERRAAIHREAARRAQSEEPPPSEEWGWGSGGGDQ